jgi:protein-disulfide isomerase
MMILPSIDENYIKTGKIKFVYRDFPLTAIHDMAQKYAEAAECADEEGKFWQMHDKIFEEQEKLGSGTIPYPGRETVVTWASQIGLNASKFKECLESGKYKEEVEKDIQDGVAAGVQGTPATFITQTALTTRPRTRISFLTGSFSNRSAFRMGAR